MSSSIASNLSRLAMAFFVRFAARAAAALLLVCVCVCVCVVYIVTAVHIHKQKKKKKKHPKNTPNIFSRLCAKKKPKKKKKVSRIRAKK